MQIDEAAEEGLTIFCTGSTQHRRIRSLAQRYAIANGCNGFLSSLREPQQQALVEL